MISLEPIQSLWIGHKLSPMHQLAIRSFLANRHPFHLYVYDCVIGLPEGVTLKDAGELLPEKEVFAYQTGPGKGSVAAFSNLFRYTLLFERGGWWVDTDVVCLRPFFGDYVFASERHATTGEVGLASCVIRCPRGSDVMKWCRDRSRDMDPATLKWGQTGPRLLAQAVRQFGLQHSVRPPSTFCPLDYKEFERVERGNFRLPDNSLSIHLWHEMWRRKDTHPRGNPGSIYRQLESLYG